MPDASYQGALFHRDATYDYPVLIRGEGIYLFDKDGNRYIDGISGAGNVTLGHGRRSIVEAMSVQANHLAYCFSAFFTNQPALELAQRIANLTPGDLNHVYFVSGGSEAIEAAMKIARQYHVHRGEEQRHLVLSRWRSYHGATLGALALTGLPKMRAHFSPWLPAFPKVTPCYPYRCSFSGCQGRCNLKCAEDLEQVILQAGPENVAAFVAEPIVLAHFAGGVPPADYFSLIREICDKYGVLFIADEVITGFGRTGKYFAIEHWNVVPDMIVFGKGVSSGYSPLAGVAFRDSVRDVFEERKEAFTHVHTYVDNPVAMRAGLAVLEAIEKEGILEHVEMTGRHLQEKAQELSKHSSVGEVRGKGLILGIELVRDRNTREPFPAALRVYKRLSKILLEKGLAVSTTSGGADFVNGDDVRFYPPLITTCDQIDEALDIMDEGLTELERGLET